MLPLTSEPLFYWEILYSIVLRPFVLLIFACCYTLLCIILHFKCNYTPAELLLRQSVRSLLCAAVVCCWNMETDLVIICNLNLEYIVLTASWIISNNPILAMLTQSRECFLLEVVIISFFIFVLWLRLRAAI